MMKAKATDSQVGNDLNLYLGSKNDVLVRIQSAGFDGISTDALGRLMKSVDENNLLLQKAIAEIVDFSANHGWDLRQIEDRSLR